MAGQYILVVDDHPDVRKLIVDVLEVMNMESREAMNGQEALRIIGEDPPALIILDLMMPVMDGFTTLTRLHADPDHKGIPVILLSAIADDPNSMQRLPGVRGVLRKGAFTIGQLRDLVLGILEEEKQK